MAFADKPTHFVNFPLASFECFLEKFYNLQNIISSTGLECKLQKVPHISITMLDIDKSQYRCVDVAIQEIIDDFLAYEGDIVLSNPHVLGRSLVLDVTGLQELHDDIVVSLREKGVTADQSRNWIPHCTVAQFIGEIPLQLNMHFFHSIQLNTTSPASIELVKIGADKVCNWYISEFSYWVGIRSCYKPPTQKLGSIIGYCCLDKIREDLIDGVLPSNDDDAWSKLKYAYENNTWFYRYVYDNSLYFRDACKTRDCICFE
ncbi:NS2 protein [Mouse coronavirus]|nr:NS2 protein [Mouse coronavirus]